MKIEQLYSMDGYTFDEGIAFLLLAKAPLGVVNHLKVTHNKSNLHSEIHKQLRMPNTMRLLKEKGFDTVPKSIEIEPKSNESVPKSNETEPESNDTSNGSPARHSQSASDDLPDDDPTSIIITQLDVRQHENTHYEDMPNDICRELWLKKNDLYHEMQQHHLKMKLVPVGEDRNEERAGHRAEILRLDGEIDDLWKLIDTEIERFKTESSQSPEVSQSRSQFDVSIYRAYISKAIRKKSLTDAQRVELQHRVDAMLEADIKIKLETLDKLKAIGIKIG